MKRILIRNGRVIDPYSKVNRVTNVLIEGSRIKAVGTNLTSRDALKIDARARLVVPGLIDMHVHLRDPGRPDEETIESGCRAAIAGGFTSIVCMPNTNPPLDNDGFIRYVYEQAGKANQCNVYPVGCITKGRQGKELAELGMMAKAGAIGFTDDGDSVHNSGVLRRALEYGKRLKTLIIEHCLDRELNQDGLMNEGIFSTSLGLRGSPSIAEEVIVARDLLIARFAGAPIHITHVSTAGSVGLIRRAKKNRVMVTADTCPHYFALTDEFCKTYDTNYRVNPPLRSETDRQAIIAGLRDGTIDCISSDHAPHSDNEKEVEFDAAPCGIIGLETVVGLVFTELVHKKKLDVLEAIAKLTSGPARALKLSNKGRIMPGADADLTIIDPKLEWVYEWKNIKSLSHNTPFTNWKFKGKVVRVIVGGRTKLL